MKNSVDIRQPSKRREMPNKEKGEVYDTFRMV